MARRRKQNVETVTQRGGLQPAFTSCPQRPPKWFFYCQNKHGRRLHASFAADYAAREFIRLIVDDDFKFLNRATILGANGVRVSITTSPEPEPRVSIDDIIEYEPRGEEIGWEMPEPHATTYTTFAMKLARVENDDVGKRPRIARDGTAAPPARAQRMAEGGVSINVIAERLGILPRDARAALRKAKTAKPAGGWVFANDDVENVEATIKSHLKNK